MQIVIELSEKALWYVKGGTLITEVLDAIRNGTRLPKGHGRLISENDAIKAIEFRDKELRKDTQYIRKRGYIDVLGIKKFIYAAPTIIEADKEDEK